MKHFTIRRGDRPPADPGPTGQIEDAVGVKLVAVLGEDWPALRPHMEVEVGSRVEQGQVIFTDRKYRGVSFVSPVSGEVESLTYGPRRTLDALVIRTKPGSEAKVRSGGGSLREMLLLSGLWPSFRTRPYGTTPAPDATPKAIVVNAVRATPQAPDPLLVLSDSGDDFREGCEALTRLTDGLVHLCQSPGAPLGPEHARIQHTSFSGTMAAGLVGTQIDHLCPGRSIWSIGYQDVAAIGHFVATGRYRSDRVLSVTGPMASPPRLLRAPLGARIADFLDVTPVRAISGRAGLSRESIYLGRFDEQLTLLPFSSGARHPRAKRRPSHSAAIATRAVEQAIAVDVLPIPLLRALSIGDAEAAERLGCLALVEEDLEAATRKCTSGVDYGACLRGVLTELMAEAA